MEYNFTQDELKSGVCKVCNEKSSEVLKKNNTCLVCYVTEIEADQLLGDLIK